MRFFKSLALLFGTSAAGAATFDQATQKTHLEALIEATLPFAEQMLAGHAEFIPFGATMGADEKVGMVGGYTGDEHPKSVDVMELLRAAYRRDGESGKIIACALAYDVRTIPPGQTEKTDAVAIDLDHRDGMSITILYPYQIGPDKKVVYGPHYATKGTGSIFKKIKEGEVRSRNP